MFTYYGNVKARAGRHDRKFGIAAVTHKRKRLTATEIAAWLKETHESEEGFPGDIGFHRLTAVQRVPASTRPFGDPETPYATTVTLFESA